MKNSSDIRKIINRSDRNIFNNIRKISDSSHRNKKTSEIISKAATGKNAPTSLKRTIINIGDSHK